MLSKILAIAFVGLLVGKLLFRPQLRALGKWLDGAVNAMLIAIVIAYTIQLVMVLTSSDKPAEQAPSEPASDPSSLRCPLPTRRMARASTAGCCTG